MKNPFLTLAILLLSLASWAESKVASEIKDVTVYLSSAKVTRAGQSQIPKGQTEVILSNLSTQINANTIQAKLKGNATLLSATYRTNYIVDKKRPKQIEEMKAQLESLGYDLSWIESQRQVYKGEIDVLNKNQKLGSQEESMTVSELGELATYYRTRMLEIKTLQLGLDKEAKKLGIDKSKIQRQLNELNALRDRPIGEIVLLVAADNQGTTSIECSYVVSQAGWSPLYDLRSKGVKDPVELTYKANVWQNTGVEWKNVNLTVSTGNPNRNNSRPILRPQYVNFSPTHNNYQYAVKGDFKAKKEVDMARSSNIYLEEKAYGGNFADIAPEYKVQVNPTQTTTQYEISLKQSIKANSKHHLVKMVEYDLPADYQYHAVPKLDNGAFLLAKIASWGQYNLMPGKAHIFFEDTYVGQSDINPYVTSDTLLLSMGRDESIKVQRTLLTEFCSKKLIGLNKKETYAYEIKVRNNKSEAITIDVLDQLPISKNKDLIVSAEELGGAKHLEKVGKLTWKLKLEPNQTKSFTFKFNVKFPKGKQIYGL